MRRVSLPTCVIRLSRSYRKKPFSRKGGSIIGTGYRLRGSALGRPALGLSFGWVPTEGDTSTDGTVKIINLHCETQYSNLLKERRLGKSNLRDSNQKNN